MTSAHEITPVDRREWWPTEYMDEIMPNGRATPTAWLYRLPDGALRFGERDDSDWPTWSVAEGETVSFCACDDLGRARLTIGEDGVDLWEPRPPDDAYLNGVDDWEMSGDGPDDFARNLRDLAGPEPGGQIDVSVWRWHHDTLCRLVVVDGEPRFVAIAPPPGATGESLAPPERAQAELFTE